MQMSLSAFTSVGKGGIDGKETSKSAVFEEGGGSSMQMSLSPFSKGVKKKREGKEASKKAIFFDRGKGAGFL